MAAYRAKGLWPFFLLLFLLLFSIIGCILAGSSLAFFGLDFFGLDFFGLAFFGLAELILALALALVLAGALRKLVQFIRRCLYWTVDGRCRLLSRSLCHV